jgi:ribulose-phosphate 3-epimerase
MNPVQIGPSLVCMDPLDLWHDIRRARDAKVDYLHFDVMDGVLVERYGLYPEIGQELRNIGIDTPIDVHLMVKDPEAAIPRFPFADSIAIHVGGNEWNLIKLVMMIQDLGKQPTLVFNLGQTIPQSFMMAARDLGVRRFMIMGCIPGKIHRKIAKVGDIIIEATKKIKQYDWSRDFTIQVDGGVTWESIRPLAQAGVNSLVCGSATLYSSPSGLGRPNSTEFTHNLQKVRELCTSL